MTGLHDELTEIRIKAADMWDAVGKLYMKENEKDEKLKDKMDFLTEDPEHYPPESKLFLKCYKLVYHISRIKLHKIIVSSL